VPIDINDPYTYSPVYSADQATSSARLQEMQTMLADVQANPEKYGQNASYLTDELSKNINTQQQVLDVINAQKAQADVPNLGSLNPEQKAIESAYFYKTGQKLTYNEIDNLKFDESPFSKNSKNNFYAELKTNPNYKYRDAVEFWTNGINTLAEQAKQGYDKELGEAIGSFRITRPNWQNQLQSLQDYYGNTSSGAIGRTIAGARSNIMGNAYRASQQANENLARMGLSRSGAKDVVQRDINQNASSSLGKVQADTLSEAASRIGQYKDWTQQQEDAAKGIERGVQENQYGSLFGSTLNDALSKYQNYVGSEMGSRLSDVQGDISSAAAEDAFLSNLAKSGAGGLVGALV